MKYIKSTYFLFFVMLFLCLQSCVTETSNSGHSNLTPVASATPLELYALGVKKFKNKEYKLAISFFEKCLVQDPNKSSPYLLIARCYYNLGQAQVAITYIEGNIQNIMNKDWAFFALGELYGEQPTISIEKSISNFKKVNPDKLPESLKRNYWNDYSRTLINTKNYPEARESIKELTKYDKNEANKLSAILGVENLPSQQLSGQDKGTQEKMNAQQTAMDDLFKAAYAAALISALTPVVNAVEAGGDPEYLRCKQYCSMRYNGGQDSTTDYGSQRVITSYQGAFNDCNSECFARFMAPK